MNNDIAASDLILNAETLIKIIDKLPHVVYLKDSKHRFLLANKACLALLNASGDDIIGSTDKNFYSENYAQHIHELERHVLRNGEKKIVPEERFTDPTGREQIMKITRLPFFIPELEEVGILGIAVNMAKEKELEESIRSQNKVLEKQKEEIDEKRQAAEDLYNKVKSGLRVSKFIQDAILPSESSVKRALPESFVLYKPKDVTNGDFYWVHAKDGYVYMATIDCTEFDAGGTFIAMLCYDLLSQILKEKYRPSPSDILHELNASLKNNLEESINISQMIERVYVNICVIDKENLYVEHCGSGAPMLLINKYSNQVLEPKNEKLGLPYNDEVHNLYDNRIRVKKGDMLYMMTDGYALQETKIRGVKEIFGYNRLRDLILEVSDFTMDKQTELFSDLINDFRGDEEQTDDIILIGVKM